MGPYRRNADLHSFRSLIDGNRKLLANHKTKWILNDRVGLNACEKPFTKQNFKHLNEQQLILSKINN